ncbi:MAG TPA: hypothetical protein VKE96_12475 [Vicinamibacterales bacterium]|nr:hypothetical protein [Vicinamibacterales bacterium]
MDANPTADDTRRYQTAMLGVAGKVERALSVASERRVANVWEYTQSVIAVCVVVTTCGGVLDLAIWHVDARLPPEWWTIAGLVIGFYFGRVRPPTSAPPPRSGFERDRATDGKPP